MNILRYTEFTEKLDIKPVDLNNVRISRAELLLKKSMIYYQFSVSYLKNGSILIPEKDRESVGVWIYMDREELNRRAEEFRSNPSFENIKDGALVSPGADGHNVWGLYIIDRSRLFNRYGIISDNNGDLYTVLIRPETNIMDPEADVHEIYSRYELNDIPLK